MTTPVSAVDHLRKLQALLVDLVPEGMFLSVHEYSDLSFGSFVAVLSAGHSQAKFLWDGEESTLTVKTRTAQKQSGTERWVHDAYINVSATDVDSEIGSNAIQVLK